MAATPRSKRQALPAIIPPRTIAGRSPALFVIGGLLITALFFGGAWKLYAYGIASSTQVPALPVRPIDDAVLPSPPVDPAALPALPDAAAIAGQDAAAAALASEAASVLAGNSEAAAHLLAAKQLITALPALPLSETPLTALALAWCGQQFARDRSPPPETAVKAAPTTYASVAAWELLRAPPPLGSALAIEGRIEAAPDAGAADGWRRHVLVDDNGGRALVVADRAWPDAGVAGPTRRVVALGRFLGVQPAPVGAPARAGELPVLAAISIAATPEQDPLRAALAGFTPGQPLLAEHPLWEHIDDDRLVIEKAPYYALLAQVGHDKPPPADARLPALNWWADAVRRNPAHHRGQRFTLVGTVVRAWEDAAVAADRPFEVKRAVRMLLYHEDYAPVTLDHDRDTQGRPKSGNFLVPRLYDVAVPGDAPLPRPGEAVRLTGRFLKYHARPFDRDAGGRFTAVPGSDRTYSPFVVAAGYVVDPNPGRPDLPLRNYGIIAVVLIFAFILLRFSHREWRQWQALKAQLRASAEKRRSGRSDC